MIIKVDKSIYSDACISKCVYSFLSDYIIIRSSDENNEVINISSKSGNPIDEEGLYATWSDRLNDYKLRCIIEQETKDIRTLLYAKAFMDCDDLTIE